MSKVVSADAQSWLFLLLVPLGVIAVTTIAVLTAPGANI